jgi:hypothetical protein
LIVRLPLVLALVVLGWLNTRVYTINSADYAPGSIGPDVIPQLNDIGRRLRAGEGADMQGIFPEGWFFSHLLYGMAWVNVGMQTGDAALKQRALDEAEWVLRESETPAGVGPFTRDTQVPNGVFYLGWRNRLLAGMLKLRGPKDRDIFAEGVLRKQSDALAAAYRASASAQLDAYPGEAWPCDNAMAIASLAVADSITPPHYQDVIQLWVARTKTQLDPAEGLIGHATDSASGAPEGGVRASSQSYLHAVLPEIDRAFAQAQFTRYRSRFVDEVLGFQAAYEYPIGTSGPGDVDSRPLIFGFSPTGSAVNLAAARVNGDWLLFDRTLKLSETLGFGSHRGDGKSYLFGQLVVADAFLVWGKTHVNWAGVTPPYQPPPPFPAWQMHLVSLVLLVPFVWLARRPKSASIRK